MNTDLIKMAMEVKKASRLLAKTTTEAKNNALLTIAEEINVNRDAIIAENATDISNGLKKGLSAAFIDRLTLNVQRVDAMIASLREVASLHDPVGEMSDIRSLPNGLKVGKMNVPIGVLAIIFESRPNVSVEVSALTLKSGNGIILRGGSDAINSNRLLVDIIRNGIRKAGLPHDCVAMVDDTSHETVLGLIRLKEYIDVVIPRGGLPLIRLVEENSTIPVIRHDLGICHTYVDRNADHDMAINICLNAKVQRPGVCNAMETLLVHHEVAGSFLPSMKKAYDMNGVVLKGCEKTCAILPGVEQATEKDWSTEYLDLILSVKIVGSLDQAIDHINTYGSHHSDAIITDSYERAMRFITEVDSAACLINASTRFNDGGEFGLGAEIGISNQKLHVRGPMGLRDLMAPKYVVFGNGQVRK